MHFKPACWVFLFWLYLPVIFSNIFSWFNSPISLISTPETRPRQLLQITARRSRLSHTVCDISPECKSLQLVQSFCCALWDPSPDAPLYSQPDTLGTFPTRFKKNRRYLHLYPFRTRYLFNLNNISVFGYITRIYLF